MWASRAAAAARRLLDRWFHSRNLLVTNTATSGVLLGIGDAIEQGLEEARGKKRKYDYVRTGKELHFLGERPS